MYQIFVVEDDPVIARQVAGYLRDWGYQVQEARDFDNIMAEFAAFQPHLVLLDLKLPKYNGFHWCREIRKVSTAPILFITSAADNFNIVSAMNMGADDLIAKPFDLHVLSAKVEALLRRAYGYGAAAQVMAYGDLIYSPADAAVQKGEERAELTRNENRILQTLLVSRGAIVSRDTLMVRLWESDSYIDENTLTVNVARLRKKLEGLGMDNMIQTKKGMGYLIP